MTEENNATSSKEHIATDDIPFYTKFLFGGIAGIGATCVVQPFHLVKNRMQVNETKPKYTYAVIQDILRKEGVIGIYNGFSAGILRQATYTSTRLGVYTWLTNEVIGLKNEEPNFVEKIGLGIFAGICAAIVGTPTEIALVRMTLDGKLPDIHKRNYKNGVHAITQISKAEGFRGLWKGVVPTVCRSVIVNSVQLATYSQAKELLQTKCNFEDGILCKVTGSTISGLLTVLCSLPVDNAKTRIQYNVTNSNDSSEHPGIIDMFRKIIRKEGFTALWKGFTPYVAKLCPHTVLTFIFLEELNDLYQEQLLKSY